MQASLRRIVQKVSATEDLNEALQLAVLLVKETITKADACSIFVVDEDQGEYVLAATDGLNPDLVGKIRLKFGVGLIGYIGERGEPVNLDDATTHEQYFLIKEAGEEKMHGFLGVPITHSREVLGVLTVQQFEKAAFDETEDEAFLVTLSTQLGAIIADAQSKGLLWKKPVEEVVSLKEVIFSGSACSPGVGVGRSLVVYPLADLYAVPDKPAEDITAEMALLDNAIESAKSEIRRLRDSISENLKDDAMGLFDAYMRMLESASLVEKIKQEIIAGQWAQAALRMVIQQHITSFESMDDPYLKERAVDLRDLGQRILFHLQSQEKKKIPYHPHTILVGEEITPAALAEIPEEYLSGIVSVRGSSNSHAAILARAMGIPAVMGVSGLSINKVGESELIIDGYYGQIYINPSHATRLEFEKLVQEEKELDAELEGLRKLPAETLDGESISLFVNTGIISDVGRALRVGAEGVGLYRTEVSYMARDRFPSEEEQRKLYRQMLSVFSPRPVYMRTLDVGGDKALPYFPIKEDNPFLGWRGIRITLDHPEIFLVQLRAMMRADIGLDNLYILLPMVSSISEVEETQRLIAQAHSELLDEGHEAKLPPLGVMIEVPSAVYQARDLAKRVDFLSVGTNDLVQYLLAVDRNNARVTNLYDTLHPAVLRALMQIIESVRQEGVRVSICGEMAGDPVSVILLLAMGFDSLSISAMRLPRMKWVIRTFTMAKAKVLLEEVLQMDDPVEIRCHMELALEEAGLGGLIRAGR